MKNLVIVESPAKAKTIAKYLNSNKSLKSLGSFIVTSSMGHIRDLKKKELGIDIANDFEPQYQVTDEKVKTVAELKKKAAECDMIWLASDYDREGEGIAMHLKEVLKLKKYKRITFTEITAKALENAILNPRLIDENLVASQETRRILDRLVGFKVSPVLWKKYRTENMSGLSAGRVQSAVMHIILEREKAIREFDSGSYWYFLGDFVLQMGKSEKHNLKETRLYKGDTVYKEQSKDKVVQLLKSLENKFTISDIKSKETKKNADLPFITSSLQQEANNKFSFPLKRTMQLAQELYEKGHITYMRTDSYTISDDFKEAARRYIVNEYGEHYYSGGSSKKKVQKNAQEAHEAIRPTDVNVLKDDLELTGDHKKLYEMIWKRTVAYFMKPCISDELDIKICDTSFVGRSTDMYFLSTFSKVKFNGFMILYGASNEQYDFSSYISSIKANKYNIKCNNILAKNTWSNPPQRFNESSIIKVLEAEGIGRPSTYASIMSKLFEKKYIMKSDVSGVEKETCSYIYDNGRIKEEKGKVTIGQERTRLVPTQIGEEIDAFLSDNFSYIVDKSFTSNMEADLDRIAEGDRNKLEVLKGFWSVLRNDLNRFDNYKATKTVLKTEKFAYNIGDKDYIVRVAKYGPVIEYVDNSGTKKYINLKPYMKYFRKELSDIGEDDITMLTRLPKNLAVIEGNEFDFVYGPYGFYGKYKETNIKLPLRTIMNILKNAVTDDQLQKELKSAIDYKNNKPIPKQIVKKKAQA
jgi:DNA topoisomerase-1